MTDTIPAEDETAATREIRAARRHRTNVVFHVVEVILLLVCTVILIYAAIKYQQVMHSLRDFGDSFNLDPSTSPAPDCIPGLDPDLQCPGG